jgi:hypothetical protein
MNVVPFLVYIGCFVSYIACRPLAPGGLLLFGFGSGS